ncbi:allene oxide synthase 3 [Manihot esculenta]|uniref:Allene oxide synthase n=1 Tax=Manihot esculenta TaxID=3983 RepID=A0A2C9UG80_MANES|nr:allene oxide synthase 3 [Manihot esculenta]OAY29455.1 hypothetical protein MANES_15G146200v8 [Manihot esculenta]
MSSSLSFTNPPANLPLKPIPGSYGTPFFGAIKDRHDYFYNQGEEEFFASRIKKYQSTVIRLNMPPGPFISQDPRVIAVLDAVSFPVLFDTSKVEKRDCLDGTFRPSVSFTGGYRTCAFLDPSEPNHNSIKAFVLSILASKHNAFIPLFRNCLSKLFTDIDKKMSSEKKVCYNFMNDAMAFSFVFQLLCEKDPADTRLGNMGSIYVDKWLALQLAPLGTIHLPSFLKFLEDIAIRTFQFPFFLVKHAYDKLYKAFYEHAAPLLDRAESFGIKRDEACHNLVFLAGFNAYGGMQGVFPALLKWVGQAGEHLHAQLAHEIRTAVKEEGGVTFQALDNMTLTKSVVYECLRLEPPVPYQYARAKKDIVVHSHDAAYEIKKGEMIFGYQPCATSDPKVFDNPKQFVADRFVGEEGEKLLNYVYWSNDRETHLPTVEDKQCPAKDQVVLLARLFLVEFFLRYDTYTVEVKTHIGLVSYLTITSLAKATSS